MYLSVKDQSGSLIWVSNEPVPLILESAKDLRIHSLSAVEDNPTGTGEIDMMPLDQFFQVDLKWCIEKVLEEI